MSNSIYPVFPGLTYSVFKTPTWSTRMQRSVSGRTLRTSDYVNPIWKFQLVYSVLHDVPFNGVSSEVRVVMDFFNSMRGAFDSFLYTDPTDNAVTGQVIGTGDGSTTIFQLVRTMVSGGFTEFIIAPNTVQAVYFNGSPQFGYSVDNTTGLLAFSIAPAAGIVISADFTFYFRCYFPDSLDFENFAFGFWRISQVKFTSIIL